MRVWRYVWPDENFDPVEEFVSEAEILTNYHPWWAAEMKRIGREHLISDENCIHDWVVLHWAEEVKQID